jgi:hypothetical protein
MPVVRVFLRCATPTNRPGGVFDSFLAVSEEALERGEHVEEVMRQARALGFAGPYRVTEVRRLDGPRRSIDEIRAGLAALVNPCRQRWLAIIDEDQARTETDGTTPPPTRPSWPRRTPRRTPR